MLSVGPLDTAGTEEASEVLALDGACRDCVSDADDGGDDCNDDRTETESSDATVVVVVTVRDGNTSVPRRTRTSTAE